MNKLLLIAALAVAAYFALLPPPGAQGRPESLDNLKGRGACYFLTGCPVVNGLCYALIYLSFIRMFF